MNAVMSCVGGQALLGRNTPMRCAESRSLAAALGLALQRLGARSPLVSPNRTPWSTSARRTHLRSVSAEQLIFADTETIAVHCESWSP